MQKRNKRAAMEMSVGTIVTIVLLMTVLILGLVLVRSIFSSATGAIDGIDKAVTNEINKLFSEDNTRKVVLIPNSRLVTIKKGEDSLGFGLAIRNVGKEPETFSYNIHAADTSCSVRLSEADDLIPLKRERSDLTIPPGQIMADPIFIRFDVPDTFPPCLITYQVDTYYRGATEYSSPIDMDLEIKSE